MTRSLWPSHELICVARKPISEKIIAENILKWGTGAMNIDESRVSIDPVADASQLRIINRSRRKIDDGWGMSSVTGDNPMVVRPSGRWPTNLIHDGSAEVTEEFPDRKTIWVSPQHKNNRSGEFLSQLSHPGQQGFNNEGSTTSRFFKATPYDNDDDDFVFNEKVKIEMTNSLDLRHGDCLDVLKTIADNSIDSIVTDPPYGLEFMGKEWDAPWKSDRRQTFDGTLEDDRNSPFKRSKVRYGLGPSYNNRIENMFAFQEWVSEWAFECYRVLKPGGYLLSFGGTRTYHWIAAGIEIAGFEIRDMVNWVYGCYSEDTECLTARGWLKYHQLKIGDRILQWNHLTDELSWYSISETLVYDAPENMVSIKNRHTDQLLTENHTVYAKLRTHSRNPVPQSYSAIEAASLKPSWRKTFPVAGKLIDGVQVDKAYIIGWWLTDAWVHADGKACMFSQSKYLTLSKLRTCLEQSDCSFSEYEKETSNLNHKNEHTFYVTGPLATYLLEHFPARDLSWDMLSWDWNSRLSLVEGLLDGDGSRRQTQHSETFWSLKPYRLDIFQALCVSLNIRSHIDYKKGCVYLNKKTNTTQLQKKHVLETIKYDGQKVWCLQTETGAFVVRRNGRPFISGNSGFPKSLNVGKSIQGIVSNGNPRFSGRKIKSVDGIPLPGSLIQEGSSLTMKDKSDSGWSGKEVIVEDETAKQWEGWGTALKPAHEPICVARKPISEKSVAENILTWGTGAMNIDESRVTTDENLNGAALGMFQEGKTVGTEFKNPDGRWPANLIHDGSVEATEEFPNTKSGQPQGMKNASHGYHGNFGQIPVTGFGDEGSASRFFKATPYDNDDDNLEGASMFYCAKASTSERDEGMTGEAKPVVTFATANGTSGKPSSISEGRYRIEYVTNDGLSEDLLKEIQEALDEQTRP